MEHCLHRTGHLGDIGHEGIAVGIAQEVEVIDMVFICHKATTTIGLLTEDEHAGDAELRHLDHQTVKGLIVLAIETGFGIAFHFFNNYKIVDYSFISSGSSDLVAFC